MESYIQKAFSRMNLSQIRAFVLYGVEQKKPNDKQSYDVRLIEATAPLNRRLESIYNTPSELTEAANDMSTALSAYEEIYMEIGMKLGARLVYQLLIENE